MLLWLPHPAVDSIDVAPMFSTVAKSVAMRELRARKRVWFQREAAQNDEENFVFGLRPRPRASVCALATERQRRGQPIRGGGHVRQQCCQEAG